MKDLKEYEKFVLAVTSEPSKNHKSYIERLNELNEAGLNISLLDTAASGLASEGGEFMEIVKKLKFHGKEPSADNIFHMKRELGDILWYWVNACNALDLDPNDVIAENVNKLDARYPGGFSVWRSENRKEGDI